MRNSLLISLAAAALAEGKVSLFLNWSHPPFRPELTVAFYFRHTLLLLTLLPGPVVPGNGLRLMNELSSSSRN